MKKAFGGKGHGASGCRAGGAGRGWGGGGEGIARGSSGMGRGRLERAGNVTSFPEIMRLLFVRVMAVVLELM